MLYFCTLMAYVTVCFLLPNLLFQYAGGNPLKNQPPVHRLLIRVYWLYFAAVLHLTGIGTLWDILDYGIPGGINLHPFSYEATVANLLNMVMMIPLGFLLPLIWEKWRNFGKVVAAGFGFSLLIEIFQLFNTRLSDVDDLIMNTLGAAAGYLVWMLYRRLFPRGCPSRREAFRAEAIVYVLLGLSGVFLLYNWRPVSDLFTAG